MVRAVTSGISRIRPISAKEMFSTARKTRTAPVIKRQIIDGRLGVQPLNALANVS